MFLIFNKQIISQVLLYSFSKWTNREITVDKFKLNFHQSSIIISGVKIKNLNEFYYDNFVEFEKIILDYNFKSLFSNLIIINNLVIENPKFFLEVIEKPSTELSPFNVQKMYDDMQVLNKNSYLEDLEVPPGYVKLEKTKTQQ